MPTTRRSTVKSAPIKGTQHHKTLLRRRCNIIGSAELIQQFNINFVPDQTNQVALRIARLDSLWDKFESVQEEIEMIENDEDDFSETREQFHNMYFELKAALVAKLPQSSTSQSNPQLTNTIPSANPLLSIKLPELKLPEFRGNPEEWIEFRDLFKSVVHSNTQLSGVQKLHYLRSSLKGEAARLISSFAITSDNYAIAWKTITDRYENVNFLVKQHMSAILKIPAIRKESATSLAELADEFNRHVSILDKLEAPENHWNSFLVECLSSLLDDKSLLEWETQCREEDAPQYDELLGFIHKRSRTLLKCRATSNQSSSNNTFKLTKGKSSSSHVASDNVPKCPGCKQPHFLYQCDGFLTLTPSKRLEFTKKHRLCINCLRGGHISKDCNSSLCRTCAKRHHTLLHLPPLAGRSRTSNQEVHTSANTQATAAIDTVAQCNISRSGTVVPTVVQSRNALQAVASRSTGSSLSSSIVDLAPFSSSVVSHARVDKEPPTYHSHETATSLTQSNQLKESTIILSTAVIRIKDVHGNYQLARALLDSGSQSNFISETLCQKLGLKRTRTNLPISGIGQAAVTVRYKVEINLASRFGSFEQPLNCLVLPKLTVSLPRRHIDISQWNIPRNLPLADLKFNVSQGVDIIIGAELFYSLIEPHQYFIANDYPLLQKTLLGYVISGKLGTVATESVAYNVAADQDLNV